ncbi:hypothetical protein RB623_23040 [Mesorhizobium sp. LHD-90]|uniref:hypothetical protein n=1 Tax=Mesorhizobium sp. LHD-90 TaxID=3071414 RepID=UPI0027E06E5A|nr:hypothetical protein [Mesorhizobium sp. LHD-90]MDQ6436937.1 hypothetical protein [Mesorhizobium sp. LHD-90]
MGGFEIKSNAFHKVTGGVVVERAQRENCDLRAIIKVKQDDYVPEGVRLTERIDEKLFTAEFAPETLETLEQDDKVRSVAVSQAVRIIE